MRKSLPKKSLPPSGSSNKERKQKANSKQRYFVQFGRLLPAVRMHCLQLVSIPRNWVKMLFGADFRNVLDHPDAGKGGHVTKPTIRWHKIDLFEKSRIDGKRLFRTTQWNVFCIWLDARINQRSIFWRPFIHMPSNESVTIEFWRKVWNERMGERIEEMFKWHAQYAMHPVVVKESSHQNILGKMRLLYMSKVKQTL